MEDTNSSEHRLREDNPSIMVEESAFPRMKLRPHIVNKRSEVNLCEFPKMQWESKVCA